MYDVAVIGGGVVGGMIARKLSSYRLDLCILEKAHDVAMGASSANSAIVHAGFDAKEGSLKAKLNVKGSEMMEKVCRELGVKYQNNGSLVIGFDEADRATVEELYRRGVANGVKELRVVERDELSRLEPNVSKNAICALYAPTGSIVCPYELTIASIGNAMDNGADLHLDFEVKKIEDMGEFFRISSGRDTVCARYIVNAAGLYSDAIAHMVGDDSFSVHPRRGEYVLLDKECGTLVRSTVFRTPSKMGKGILVSPTVDGNLLTGPTSFDMEDKTDRSTTAEGLSLVMKQAGENVEGVQFGKSITSFCGLRAVGSTGDFIINLPRPRFVNAAGIESPGLSSAPAIAEYVAELLASGGLALDGKQDFNPYRAPMHAFREGTLEEKNEMIKKDPSYGHIICRCETVSEGEILAAIRQNPKPRDLDGVKRRTRAQMGRCQGGFCAPYIVELLANEMQIPYEEVTKFGGGSLINYNKTKGEEIQ
ncbi:MAG: NAD(P)/FAD-dependent oxidoreductase [Ruminococcaceae bacterium]|nr:NAD(P)/FAD-dependent oxidoreductase [Oscillospiraceae bacterium]